MQEYETDRTPTDYCVWWNSQERQEGYLWQKLTNVYTRRLKDGSWTQQVLKTGGRMQCQRSCLCGETIKDSRGRKLWKHRASLEDMSGLVKQTGLEREQLKCTYPSSMVTSWLQWALE